LGFGDWGSAPTPQTPIPNPQSPIPKLPFYFLIYFFKKYDF